MPAATGLHKQLEGYWRLQKDLGNGRFALDVLDKTAFDTKKFGLIQLEQFIGSDRKMRNFPRRKGRKAKGNIKYNVNSKGARIRFVPGGLWGLIQSDHPPTRDLIGTTEAKIPGYFIKHQDRQVARRLR